MGKGDKRSRRGKIWKGSYGNSRRKKEAKKPVFVPKPKAKKAVAPSEPTPADSTLFESAGISAPAEVKVAKPKKVATKIMIDTAYRSKIKEWILGKDETGYIYGRTITKLTKKQKIWMEHWVPVDNSTTLHSPNSGLLFLQLCKGCKDKKNEIGCILFNRVTFFV